MYACMCIYIYVCRTTQILTCILTYIHTHTCIGVWPPKLRKGSETVNHQLRNL